MNNRNEENFRNALKTLVMAEPEKLAFFGGHEASGPVPPFVPERRQAPHSGRRRLYAYGMAAAAACFAVFVCVAAYGFVSGMPGAGLSGQGAGGGADASVPAHGAISQDGDGYVSREADGAASAGGDGAVSQGGDGYVSVGGDGAVSAGDDGAVSAGGDGAVSKGGDGAVSKGVDDSDSAEGPDTGAPGAEPGPATEGITEKVNDSGSQGGGEADDEGAKATASFSSQAGRPTPYVPIIGAVAAAALFVFFLIKRKQSAR